MHLLSSMILLINVRDLCIKYPYVNPETKKRSLWMMIILQPWSMVSRLQPVKV